MTGDEVSAGQYEVVSGRSVMVHGSFSTSAAWLARAAAATLPGADRWHIRAAALNF
jgi:hypothetical protein